MRDGTSEDVAKMVDDPYISDKDDTFSARFELRKHLTKRL